jgi:electron transfer flavoprotein-quinone oxidoreductase
MTSGRLAAETIFEAIEKNDFSSRCLEGYVKRLNDSYVLTDLKKYRRFPSFLETHKELFTTLPRAACGAAREVLTVDGLSKKARQGLAWKAIRGQVRPLRLLRLIFDAWRSVR